MESIEEENNETYCAIYSRISIRQIPKGIMRLNIDIMR